VLGEKDAEELDNYKLLDEVSILAALEVLFPHEVHELADEFGDEEVEGGIDEGDDDSCQDFVEVGKDEIEEELVLLFRVVKALDPTEEGEAGFAKGDICVEGCVLAGAESTRYIWTKQCRCR
jgi:hypothetical protein